MKTETENQIVEATKNTLTRGTYMGETGVGYRWGAPADPGDYSGLTHGKLQGRTDPAKIEILRPGCRLEESQAGELLLFVPEATRDGDGYVLNHRYGLSATDALRAGIARVVEEDSDGR